jgi:hypothetical protein
MKIILEIIKNYSFNIFELLIYFYDKVLAQDIS